jgi:hypothetical protein
MARIEHEHADARDAARTLIALEARKHVRRLKAEAEDTIAEAYAEASVRGLPFDAATVAREAVAAALVTVYEVGPGA